jgi:hypothetical protein
MNFHCILEAVYSLTTYIGNILNYVIFRNFVDSHRSDINLGRFPVFSALETFCICSFCLTLLYYHNFKCRIQLRIAKCEVAPTLIRSSCKCLAPCFVFTKILTNAKSQGTHAHACKRMDKGALSVVFMQKKARINTR